MVEVLRVGYCLPFLCLSGGCLSLHWQAWRDRGAEPWVVEVLRVGYCLPFLSTPPLSNAPLPMPSYSPTSIKGAALEEVTLGLVAKGAVDLAPLPSPGFYSRLFVVWKTSGSWRPVIDLSHLNRFVDASPFQMDGDHSVCAPVGASGGLDGLHRSPGSVSSGAGSSCFSSLSALRLPGQGLSVQSSLLWPLHSSASGMGRAAGEPGVRCGRVW